MKQNNQPVQETTNISVVDFSDDSKKALFKPLLPANTRYEERTVIPALMEDEAGQIVRTIDGEEKRFSLNPWKKFFYYQARLWVLYKTKPSASAAWYFVARLNGKHLRRSCETNKLRLAVGHAVDNWINPTPDEASKNKQRKGVGRLKLDKFFAAWLTICGEVAAKDGNSNCRNVIGCARRILGELWPNRRESEIGFDELFNSKVGRKYKKARVARFEREAIEKHGKGDVQAIKRARAKAKSGSAVSLKRIKSFFADTDGSLIDEYKDLGIELPEADIRRYRDTKIKGAGASQLVYKRPDDEVISRTFREIEKFNCDEPLMVKGSGYTRGGVRKERVHKKAWSRRKGSTAGIADARKYHIYCLFWECVGFGLRVKEAASTRKNQHKTIDGQLCVQGIGKTEGSEIDIPAQPDAVTALKPWLRHDDGCEYLLGPNWNYRYYVIPKVLRGLMRDWGWETDNLIHQLRAFIGWKIYMDKDAGGPVAAQHYLRHRKLQTTTDMYAGKFMVRQAASIDLKNL